jgi:hypothetical protein
MGETSNAPCPNPPPFSYAARRTTPGKITLRWRNVCGSHGPRMVLGCSSLIGARRPLFQRVSIVAVSRRRSTDWLTACTGGYVDRPCLDQGLRNSTAEQLTTDGKQIRSQPTTDRRLGVRVPSGAPEMEAVTSRNAGHGLLRSHIRRASSRVPARLTARCGGRGRAAQGRPGQTNRDHQSVGAGHGSPPGLAHPRRPRADRGGARTAAAETILPGWPIRCRRCCGNATRSAPRSRGCLMRTLLPRSWP